MSCVCVIHHTLLIILIMCFLVPALFQQLYNVFHKWVQIALVGAIPAHRLRTDLK